MNDCLDQVGLWICLWGIVTIDKERPGPLWAAPFSGLGSWNVLSDRDLIPRIYKTKQNNNNKKI